MTAGLICISAEVFRRAGRRIRVRRRPGIVCPFCGSRIGCSQHGSMIREIHHIVRGNHPDLYFGGGVPEGRQADPGTGRVVELGEDMISIVGEPRRRHPQNTGKIGAFRQSPSMPRQAPRNCVPILRLPHRMQPTRQGGKLNGERKRSRGRKPNRERELKQGRKPIPREKQKRRKLC